jgi:hypothetical protein
LRALNHQSLDHSNDALSDTVVGLIHYSEDKCEEYDLGILVGELLGEPLQQRVQHVQDLQAAFRIEVAQVLYEVVDVLLHSLCLQRVLKEELRKDARAYPSGGLGQGGYHHVLDRLNQIVEVCTHEPPID